MEYLRINDLEKLETKEVIDLKNKLLNLDTERKKEEVLITRKISKLNNEIDNLNKKKYTLYNDYDKNRNNLVRNNQKVINDLWLVEYLQELNYLNDLFKNSKIGGGFINVKLLIEDNFYNETIYFRVKGFELQFIKGIIKINLEFNEKEINKSFMEIIEIQNIPLDRLIKNKYTEKKKFTDLHNFNEIEKYLNTILHYTENQIKNICRVKVLNFTTQIKNKKKYLNIEENKKYLFYFSGLNNFSNKIFLIKKVFGEFSYEVYNFEFYLDENDNKFLFNSNHDYIYPIDFSKYFKTFKGCINNIINNYNVDVEKIKELKFKNEL